MCVMLFVSWCVVCVDVDLVCSVCVVLLLWEWLLLFCLVVFLCVPLFDLFVVYVLRCCVLRLSLRLFRVCRVVWCGCCVWLFMFASSVMCCVVLFCVVCVCCFVSVCLLLQLLRVVALVVLVRCI